MKELIASRAYHAPEAEDDEMEGDEQAIRAPRASNRRRTVQRPPKACIDPAAVQGMKDTSMQNPIRGTAVTIAAVLLLGMMASCSTVPKDFEMPKVSISDITPKDMTLMEQRFDVQLRIQNPNPFALGLNGVRFAIDLNGKQFGYGLSGQTVTIPRFSSVVVTGELITGLGSILRQVRGLGSAMTKVQYRLKGTIFTESPNIFSADFEDVGDIDLSFEPADQQ